MKPAKKAKIDRARAPGTPSSHKKAKSVTASTAACAAVPRSQIPTPCRALFPLDMISSRELMPTAWNAQTHALSPSWRRKKVRMLPRIVTVTAVPTNQAATLPTWLAIHASAFDRTCPSASPSCPPRPLDKASAWSLVSPDWIVATIPGTSGTTETARRITIRADREDRQEGHGTRRLRPRPAPITQPGRDRREQHGHDHGEQDCCDDGPEDHREIGEDDDQREHHENAPAECGRVAQPVRNQRTCGPRAASRHSPTVRRFSQVR